MKSRVKFGCGIEEAKKEIQQLKTRVEKFGEIGKKSKTAVRKAERRGGEWSKRGYR